MKGEKVTPNPTKGLLETRVGNYCWQRRKGRIKSQAIKEVETKAEDDVLMNVVE